MLHLAYHRGGMDDFDETMRVNAEGTLHVLLACRVVPIILSIGAARQPSR